MSRDGLFEGDGKPVDGQSVAPAVIGADFVVEDTEPVLVYLPSEQLGKDDTHATIEFRRIDDGRLAVLAYTSLETLVNGCGEHQPWVQLSNDKIDGIVTESGADVVLWDAELPAEQRRDEE